MSEQSEAIELVSNDGIISSDDRTIECPSGTGSSPKSVRAGSEKSMNAESVRAYLNGTTSPFKRSTENRITYIDLFCGGGGLSLGVHHALSLMNMNARLLCAVDVDPAALKLTHHHFKPIIQKCISVEDLVEYDVDVTGVKRDFVLEPTIVDSEISQFAGKVDLLVGGPPCQGHSNLNNWTRRQDPRNLLYYIMPAFAIALDIPCIIIENVKSIRHASENVVEITKAILDHYGYDVYDGVVDASSVGVAQTRVRHFLVASKTSAPDVESTPDVEASVNAFKMERLSFNDINSKMPRVKGMLKLMEKNGSLSKENQLRIQHLHRTGSFELENALRPECHRNGHTYPSVYGRMHGDKPAGTITTGFGTPGRGRFIHPDEPRMMTMREAARIQSFPDWYFKDIEHLDLTRNSLFKIIGDAVPSLMVAPLIQSLSKSLERRIGK